MRDSGLRWGKRSDLHAGTDYAAVTDQVARADPLLPMLSVLNAPNEWYWRLGVGLIARGMVPRPETAQETSMELD
jgi:hypothetical protein